jgi:hypothetical protein
MKQNAASSIASSQENAQQQQQQQPPTTSLPDPTTLTVQQDPWQICHSTRVLASFLRGKDLLRLSSCGHHFLSFRTQIQHLRLRRLKPSVVAHMSTGGLTSLTTLKIDSIHVRGCSYEKVANNLGPFFRGLPHLEQLSLYCSCVPLPIIATILNSLVKVRLKTLVLSSVGTGVAFGDGSVLAGALKDFRLLEILDLQYFYISAIVPHVVGQLERGAFPCLQSLRISCGSLPESAACSILQAIWHGRLPCLESLDLSHNNLGDDIVDDAIRAMPHLNYMDLHHTNTFGGHTRLREAAAEFVNLKLRL